MTREPDGRLAPGTRLGPYEIVASIGAGGMGEVYRARDTRLGRDVAVKVLPAHRVASPEVRARFEREARAVSSLNHPNICTLHDIGRVETAQGPIDYLVMELIDGETLAERLRRGPLPSQEVLRFGVQVADALDRAHRQGIVHRDLKPGNIMLTKAGAKLLDFGLARPTGLTTNAGDLSQSPTASRALTAEGTIVGTFQYMAPEQLEGKETDARTDIFAFGATLYEAATGRRAFEGASQASLIAAIMNARPAPMTDTTGAAPATPAALQRIVSVCLARDPDDRWQSASDLKRELAFIAEDATAQSGVAVRPSTAGAVGVAAAARPGRERLAWAVAAIALFVAAGLGVAVLFRTPPPARRIVASFVPPPKVTFSTDGVPMALSDDGRWLAFVGRDAAGKSLLYVRPLESSEARPLPGTDEAVSPFWSPDGKKIGFFAQGKLKTIEIAGGQPEILADARIGLGGAWGNDGTILFAPDFYTPIHRVPSTGGDPVAVTPDGGAGMSSAGWPVLLPDGRHFIYTVVARLDSSAGSGIFVGSLDGGEPRRLLPVLSNARYHPAGYLIYARDGSLRAQPFDAGTAQLGGDPVTLFDGVRYASGDFAYSFSASTDGLIVYLGGGSVGQRRFTWVDRSGAITGTVGDPGLYYSPRLSGDGRRLVYDRSDPATDAGDIWIMDLDRGVSSRLSFDPGNESAPVWSADDSRVAFFRDSGGRDIFVTPANGSGGAEVLIAGPERKRPSHWSRDGRWLLFDATGREVMGSRDLWVWNAGERQARAWLQTPFLEEEGRFSPDGRWLAWTSDESGRREVYVGTFPEPTGKWRVSVNGGTSPIWRGDGREIYFISPDSMVMAAAVTPGPAFKAEVPRALFRPPGQYEVGSGVHQYDVAADGQRFLMVLGASEDATAPMTLVTDWLGKVRGR